MTKKQLKIKSTKGVTQYYIDDKEVSHAKYLNAYAQNAGFKNHYRLSMARKYKGFNQNPIEYMVKEEHINKPDGLVSIPSAPEYYANMEGQIWCYSNKRKCWIMLTSYSNPNNNNYCTVQPYINGKRYIRYVHRLVAEAFYGPVAKGYDVHHKDHNVTNNKVSNLEIMEMSLHRSMKKVNKKVKENLAN